MGQVISGSAYVLGNNIDTDQMIPAEHLAYSLSNPEERKNYGKFTPSSMHKDAADLPDKRKLFIAEGGFESEYTTIEGGNFFGCGSSQEHAPTCLKIANIQAKTASSYARIFYRNSVDGGLFTPFEAQNQLVNHTRT